MVNEMVKSMLKSELARAAGVSPRTFTRWIAMHQAELSAMGIPPTAHLVPPVGVRYICERYGIDL